MSTTEGQVDRIYGYSSGLAVKAPVRAVATDPITLYGEQTVGLVAVVTGDRVLVRGQADPVLNGIYIVNTSTWRRAADFDGNRDAADGTLVIARFNNSLGLVYQLVADGPVRIGTTALTFNPLISPLTIYDLIESEALSGAVIVDYAYPPADARRYGFSEEASAAQNATAITTAFNALPKTFVSYLSGTVYLAAGQYACDQITVPPFARLKGSGKRATTLTYAGSGEFMLLGGSSSTLNFGIVVSELTILLEHKDSTAIRALCCQQARISDLYLEGAITTLRTNKGIVIDGGNASAFGNHIEDVNCNHMQNAYQVITSGTQRATAQQFTNCYATGDVGSVGAGSIGFYFGPSEGDGTKITGGNIEAFGTGFKLDGSLSINVDGTRLEANTLDVRASAGCMPSNFRGLVNEIAGNVVDVDGVCFFEDCVTVYGTRWRKGRIGGNYGARGIVRMAITLAGAGAQAFTIPEGLPDTSFDVFWTQITPGAAVALTHNKGSNTTTTFSVTPGSSTTNSYGIVIYY